MKAWCVVRDKIVTSDFAKSDEHTTYSRLCDEDKKYMIRPFRFHCLSNTQETKGVD